MRTGCSFLPCAVRRLSVQLVGTFLYARLISALFFLTKLVFLSTPVRGPRFFDDADEGLSSFFFVADGIGGLIPSPPFSSGVFFLSSLKRTPWCALFLQGLSRRRGCSFFSFPPPCWLCFPSLPTADQASNFFSV